MRRLLWPRSLVGKAGVAAAGLLVALGIAYGAAVYFTGQRLAAAAKVAEQQGFTHDLMQLLGPPAKPEDNAAFSLDQAAGAADRCTAAAHQKHNVPMTSDGMENAAFVAEFEALLKAPDYEPQLAEADRRPVYRSRSRFPRPVSFAVLDMTVAARRRSVARAEYAIAMHLVNKGQPNEAAQRLVRLLRITRKWQDQEPFQAFLLVNLAVRGVATKALNDVLHRGGPLINVQHAEIDAELAAQEMVHGVLPWLLKTEAVVMLDFPESLPIRRVPFSSIFLTIGETQLWETAVKLQTTSRMPYVDARNAEGVLGSELVKSREFWPGFMSVSANGLWTSFTMTRRSAERCVARTRCLRVVNAWAARGDFGAGIETLGLPKESLIDPFDGAPLRVKRTPRGAIVYSVGDDLTDDGGKIDDPSPTDIGFGPPAEAK